MFNLLAAQCIDILVVETWPIFFVISECVPSVYDVLHISRKKVNTGGDVAVVYRYDINLVMTNIKRS